MEINKVAIPEQSLDRVINFSRLAEDINSLAISAACFGVFSLVFLGILILKEGIPLRHVGVIAALASFLWHGTEKTTKKLNFIPVTEL
ncbi:MAG: hypothetical protein ACLFQV_07120 [Vulcanimicrobiota bacterium]